jgi:hypothetical protein
MNKAVTFALTISVALALTSAAMASINCSRETAGSLEITTGSISGPTTSAWFVNPVPIDIVSQLCSPIAEASPAAMSCTPVL